MGIARFQMTCYNRRARSAQTNMGSSGVAGSSTRYRSGRTPWTEAAIALQVERQPLEQAHHIAQPITAPFQHFELVVQPFDKAAALTVDEVVGNQVQPGVEQLEEGIEAGQTTLCHARPPIADAPQSILLRARGVENHAQLLT